MNMLGRLLQSYNGYEQDEMRSIHRAFEQCCYPIEKEYTPTTLQDAPKKNERDKDEKEVIPRFFQMDKEFKLPRVYEENFQPNTDLSYWTAKLGRQSHLNSHIQEMLAYICENQCIRDQGLFKIGDREIYKESKPTDPTNLFYEEFKHWLLELSKKSILDENLLKVINGRIKYLQYIYVNNVFKPENDRGFPRLARVLFITKILENNVKPLINNFLSRISAREHFSALKISSTSFLYAFVKFLFYFPRKDKDIPINFIMGEIRNPTLPSYKEVLKNTSGKLLQCLVKSEGFQFIFPSISAEEDVSVEFTKDPQEFNQKLTAWGFAHATGNILLIFLEHLNIWKAFLIKNSKKEREEALIEVGSSLEKELKSINPKNISSGDKNNLQLLLRESNIFKNEIQQETDIKDILYNNFIKEDGTLYFPIVENQLTLDNWYKSTNKATDPGVIDPFRKSRLMNTFIKLHGQLQQFCMFTLICDMLFELAGDGGDLLVYGCAADKVQFIIDNYEILSKDMHANLRFLYQEASGYEQTVKFIKNTEYKKAWKFIEESYASIKEAMTECDKSIEKIKIKRATVNNAQYKTWILKKLEFFFQCVNYFSKAIQVKKTPENNKTATDNNNVPLSENLHALTPHLGEMSRTNSIIQKPEYLSDPIAMSMKAKELVNVGEFEQAIEVYTIVIEYVQQKTPNNEQEKEMLHSLLKSRAILRLELHYFYEAKNDVILILADNQEDKEANELLEKITAEIKKCYSLLS